MYLAPKWKLISRISFHACSHLQTPTLLLYSPNTVLFHLHATNSICTLKQINSAISQNSLLRIFGLTASDESHSTCIKPIAKTLRS